MNISVLLIIIIFTLISLSILFLIKTRTTRIIAIISSQLSIIFIFNLYLTTFNNFKEFILVITIYSIVILFLISNNKSFFVDLKEEKILNYKNNFFKFYLPLLILIISIVSCIILMINTTTDISKIIIEKKLNQKNELLVNPLLLPSHSVHMTVKRFYLGKKFSEIPSDNVENALEENIFKRQKIKEKLSNNMMLKRTSDIIIILVGMISAILILSNKKTNNYQL